MLYLRGIAAKVAVAVAGAVTLGFALLTVLLHTTAEQRLYQEADQDAVRWVEAAWGAARGEMFAGRHETMRHVIVSLAGRAGVKRVQLLDHDGVVRYSSNPAEEGTKRPPTAPECRRCHAGGSRPLRAPPWSYAADGRTLGVVHPLYNTPACQQSGCHAPSAGAGVLGVVLMSLSMDQREATAADLRRQLYLFAALLTLVITTTVFVLLTKLLGKPVGELVEGTRRLAAGDLGQPIPVRSSDEIGLLARSFNENTERLARAQRQLHEMEKLASVGRLAAGVAHEINNPLTGILTYAEALREDLTPEQRADVDAIIGEALRCRDIVRRLLDFARRRPPAKRATDLNQLVKHVIQLLERQKALGHVRVVRRLAPELPTVMLDSSQFHQVLVNLVVNAAEATPAGGTITVVTAASPDGAGIHLDVSDTGSGVPPEVRSHIFDPFFTTKTMGTGLGLPVAWGIVQQHGGRLSFVTTAERGTTFTVELPLAPGEGGPPYPGAHAGTAP
ncbi:MAG: HAMP domain-containing protein [Polyangiaceae bacterium]|nr:HAMP domain-containing protein [Polyangiaceae bacterium]